MKQIHLFSITSFLHKEIPLSPAEEQFIKGDITLLTSGRSNSLAASMEILS